MPTAPASLAPSTIRARVKRGIALLDSSGPEGWRDRIDLDTLDVSSLDNCVLAQVYGSEDLVFGGFCAGTADLFGASFGNFDASVSHGYEAQGDAAYKAVTAQWVRVLSKGE